MLGRLAEDRADAAGLQVVDDDPLHVHQRGLQFGGLHASLLGDVLGDCRSGASLNTEAFGGSQASTIFEARALTHFGPVSM